MIWSYGVTTTPARLSGLLERTLASLAQSGFDRPRLFVDGDNTLENWTRFGLDVTLRQPVLRTYGNWVLSMWELYVREPIADRFAIFQDDLVTCLNLRNYLEATKYPEKSYLNLYTFPMNQAICPRELKGWYPSNQLGKGAVALVFNREAVTTLLAQPYLVARPQDPKKGWKSVDGGIVVAMKNAGWKEYVHNPSLVQHTGLESSMGNKRHPLAISFPGEAFNAMSLVKP